MANITIITPLHIGNGESYYSFSVYNDMRYPLEAMLDTVEDKQKLLDPIYLEEISNNRKASNMSNDEFFKYFHIEQNKVDIKSVLYPVKMNSLRNGQIFEFIKTTNQMYIPGSSIKGYIVNLAWYDMISNNSEIRNYMESNIRHWKKIENRVGAASESLICRDIIFAKTVPTLYEINRFGSINKRTNQETFIPVGLIETIDQNNKLSNIEILASHDHKMKEYYKKVKNHAIININKSRFLNLNEKNIENIMVDELFWRLSNLDKWFKKVAKEFTLNNIDEEINYLKKVNNSKINKPKLFEFYQQIQKKLNDGNLIIRLGKYTNYYHKSVGPSFGQIFYDRFASLFSPSKDKKSPGIRTMNILKSKTGMFDTVPGYVEIEF